MSDLIEAVENPVVSRTFVVPETSPDTISVTKEPKAVDIYEELVKRDFSALLWIRDYLSALLTEKAEDERAALIEKSAELSGYFGLEVAELLTPPKKKSEIKYRDENGNSWTGKGPKPAWFKAAIDSGIDPETFRV